MTEDHKTIFLKQALEAGVCMGLPGICLAIHTAQDKSLVLSEGCSDLETQLPIQGDKALFGIGSITKVFVAVMILQLVDEERLDLEACAFDYLPNDIVVQHNGATVRHLLQHQSGIPTWEFQEDWIRDARGSRTSTRRWGKKEPLLYLKNVASQEPGYQFSYSNTNYTLLGLLIESVTGNDFCVELQNRILHPLRLKDTYLDGYDHDKRRPTHNYHFATTAFRESAGISKVFRKHSSHLIDTSDANLSTEFTAGGIVTTMTDLTTFGMAVRDGKLLSDSMQEELFRYSPPRTNVVGDDSSGAIGRTLEEMGDYYCRGICKKILPGGFFYGHGGLVLGFCSSMMLFPKAVVSVATNVGIMHSGFDASPWDLFLYNVLLPALERYLGESPLQHQ